MRTGGICQCEPWRPVGLLRTLGVALGLLCIGGGCGSAQADSAGGFSTEGCVLAAVGGAASFSFEYTAPPPDGRQIHAAAIRDSPSTCSAFRGSGPPDSFEALNVVIRGSLPGSRHEIVPDCNTITAGEGCVEWVRVASSEVEWSVLAVGGSITYESGPRDESEWHASATARFQVTAMFEVDPVVASECEATIDVGTNVMTASCTCRRASGATFSCDSLGMTCCGDEIGEVGRVDFQLDSEACPEQCSFTDPSLVSYCRALQ